MVLFPLLASVAATAARSHRGRGRHFLLNFLLTLLLVMSPGALPAAPLAGSPFAGPAAEAWATADDPSAPNRVALVSVGYDALLLRVHLIRHATTSIAIQTFIWTNDECGRLLMYELIEAARRGVKVQIIADHFASDQDPQIVAFLATAHPNLEIKHHRPALARLKPSWLTTTFAVLRSFRGFNQRMHNKVMLFDDAVLITGGRNIENTYFDHSTELNFRDRDVLAVGPVAREARRSFDAYWEFRHCVPSHELRDVSTLITQAAFRRYEHRDDFDFGGYFLELPQQVDVAAQRFHDRLMRVDRATFVADDPGKFRDRVSRSTHVNRELRHTLEQAQHTITIQTPYLVLSKPARRLLRRLQEQHTSLTIRISTNSFASTDNLMAYSGNYRLRNLYVQDLGLHVYEFKPVPASLLHLFPRHPEMARRAAPRLATGQQARAPFLCLHSKSLVVDDRLAFVGSYNLDPRSQDLNTEAGLLVEDAVFAQLLRAEIEADMQPGNSWVIARRPRPLGLDVVNGLATDLLSLSPLDLWPIQNTSSYELRAGSTAVPPDHADFFANYVDVGAFPGAEGWLSQKEIVTRLYKVVGKPLTPLL